MSLFDLPEGLPLASRSFLEYITRSHRYTGLCSFTMGHDYSHKSYEFLKNEIERIYKYKEEYPIEVAFLTITGNWYHDPELYYHDTDFNDLESPAMKLRFWWAYNLAVAYARQYPA
jgi:hypothetical protein